jgi:hypothetical protein
MRRVSLGVPSPQMSVRTADMAAAIVTVVILIVAMVNSSWLQNGDVLCFL